jgi:outer membrane protein insertion porin family
MLLFRILYTVAALGIFSLSAVARAESASPSPPDKANIEVRSIQVAGTQRIDSAAVETYLGIAPGSTVSREDINEGLGKLYATGFFSDVKITPLNNSLKVEVQENPSINEVRFEGNDQIDKEDLEKEISLKSRSVYTRNKVQDDLKRLLEVYRRNGRYSAQITPKIVPLEQNRVDLVYEITEGPEAKIRHITFIGNDSFSTSTLEQVLNSEEEAWWRFLSDNDKYDPDRLNYDQELLRRFYREQGYADFKVTSAIAELSPQKEAFYLTFTLAEGPQYTLGKVEVKSSLPKAKLPDFSERIVTKTGDTFNATDMETSVDNLIAALGDEGFAFVDIDPQITRRTEGKTPTIDLAYQMKEGPRVYIERINITGNNRTLDEVIRREFRLAEGDAYSNTKLKRSEQRLNNLGYFEKVTVSTDQGSTPDKTVVNVDVVERSTGEITMGAGFSTSDGALADLGIRERNFLGHGQDLRARVMFAERRQQYDIGFTEPYFLGRELETGFDLYRTVQTFERNANFDREANGVNLRTAYKLGEKTKHQLRYGYELNEISNVDDDASIYIQQQEGEFVTSLIGQSLIFDERDNRFSPTSGAYFRANQDLAGLGGDDQFLRHEVQSEYYIPLAKKWTLLFAGALGHIEGISDDVRISQRFFIGSKEIRGFANAGIGPRDAATEDALGGNTYYIGSAEVRFPLGLPDDLGVSGAAFVDAGSLFGLDIAGAGIDEDASPRVAAGFGIAWSSPFGPIRLDFASALAKEDYDETELVRFSFGTRF